MATIQGLMLGKIPGTRRLTRTTWTEDQYFIPYYKASDNAWRGLDETGANLTILDAAATSNIWSIHPSVANTKKVYLYLYYAAVSGRWQRSSRYYDDDTAFLADFPNLQAGQYRAIAVSEEEVPV